jgi:hypothetical protein
LQASLTALLACFTVGSMLIQKAIDYYGSRLGLRRAVGYSRAAVHQWKRVVPLQAAQKLEALTNGELKVDPSLYQPNGMAIQTVVKPKKKASRRVGVSNNVAHS